MFELLRNVQKGQIKMFSPVPSYSLCTEGVAIQYCTHAVYQLNLPLGFFLHFIMALYHTSCTGVSGQSLVLIEPTDSMLAIRQIRDHRE